MPLQKQKFGIFEMQIELTLAGETFRPLRYPKIETITPMRSKTLCSQQSVHTQKRIQPKSLQVTQVYTFKFHKLARLQRVQTLEGLPQGLRHCSSISQAMLASLL